MFLPPFKKVVMQFNLSISILISNVIPTNDIEKLTLNDNLEKFGVSIKE